MKEWVAWLLICLIAISITAFAVGKILTGIVLVGVFSALAIFGVNTQAEPGTDGKQTGEAEPAPNYFVPPFI